MVGLGETERGSQSAPARPARITGRRRHHRPVPAAHAPQSARGRIRDARTVRSLPRLWPLASASRWSSADPWCAVPTWPTWSARKQGTPCASPVRQFSAATVRERQMNLRTLAPTRLLISMRARVYALACGVSRLLTCAALGAELARRGTRGAFRTNSSELLRGRGMNLRTLAPARLLNSMRAGVYALGCGVSRLLTCAALGRDSRLVRSGGGGGRRTNSPRLLRER